MEPIKFRVWDLIKTQFVRIESAEFKDGELSDVVIAYADHLERRLNGADLVFMQYTGLEDEGDKEIFESDVLLNPGDGALSEVVFEDAGFKLHWFLATKPLAVTLLGIKHRQVRLVGNIYENPNLLRDAKA